MEFKAMAANLNYQDGKVSFAYLEVDGGAWHGQGQAMPQEAPQEAWEASSGFNRDIVATRVRLPIGKDLEGNITYKIDDNHVAFMDSVSKDVLGYASGRYQLVQPKQVSNLFFKLAKEHDFKISTMGRLGSGSIFWALARLPQSFTLTGNDKVENFMLLATSCDGSLATTGKNTSVRVVCQNTLSGALKDSGKVVRVKHSTKFEDTRFLIDMGVIDQSWQQMKTESERLSQKRLSLNEAKAILVASLGDPTAFLSATDPAFLVDVKSGAVTQEQAITIALAAPQAKKALEDQPNIRPMSEVLTSFIQGASPGAALESSKGTAWGLVNAATFWADHVAGRSLDTRLQSAYFGTNAARKEKVYASALALAS